MEACSDGGGERWEPPAAPESLQSLVGECALPPAGRTAPRELLLTNLFEEGCAARPCGGGKTIDACGGE